MIIFDDWMASSGGGTPNTGGGRAFRPTPAEFNGCLQVNVNTGRLHQFRIRVKFRIRVRNRISELN